MPSQLALQLCLCFIAWLFYRDYRRGDRVSLALWIPLLWLFILGSRPISAWFGFGSSAETNADPLEGSPFDALFFLMLIMAGALVLASRPVNWEAIYRNNHWLVFFFLYLGISVLWSDYPLVSFKRWIKDLGNIVMVLIVLSDSDPIRAAKILLARCCYLLVPLSVLLIKYFPVLGRYYDRWNGSIYYCGMTTDKNILGMTLFVCCLSLIWILFELMGKRIKLTILLKNLLLLFLMGMAAWLLQQAHSSTATACTFLGALVLLALRFAPIRRHFWVYGGAVIGSVLFVQVAFNLSDVIARTLGRDMTLTGRTDIWTIAIHEGPNPLIGAGFYSFWLGNRVAKLSEGYHYLLNEAHNGYLETYLNSGFIGVFLLFALFVSAGKRLKREAMTGEPFATFRLACFLAILPYGFTESIFNRLTLVWFLFLLVITDYPRKYSVPPPAIRSKILQPGRVLNSR
ncbi:MAG: O-antigen ligase family protein [Verrucomicrobia bacterium]|nr:O-antigen ligase family protein [Verrucomicrobiota bacterium]